ncbi:beta-glucosidase 24-like [Andrographis paniculata]|uniref:beta-glucosidase 24-like n=1 Tax=Andrographis paniculata TaxID=175694 RepID=UPI0021E8CF4D|nr:beta-glucosidase 24-like [Andrographis paniculata]
MGEEEEQPRSEKHSLPAAASPQEKHVIQDDEAAVTPAPAPVPVPIPSEEDELQVLLNQKQVERYINGGLSRHSFPPGFLWGAATSAYQIEGAYAHAGKSLSYWDSVTLNTPGRIKGGANGCVAIDHYNRFQEDVALMKRLGIDTYRFSISWCRILPGGKLSAGVNQEGINFYNDLINLLLSQKIKPCVTIFHWDLPQCLDDEYGGFLSPRIIDDFAAYAQVCFSEFGDRVDTWITINEPRSYAIKKYLLDTFSPTGEPTQIPVDELPLPYRDFIRTHHSEISPDGAGTVPYVYAHNLLLAHAKAVQIYRQHFQAKQQGQIGISNTSFWYEPLTKTKEDIDAASRAIDFNWGWFMEPLVRGDYPDVMKLKVGDRLPKFNDKESTMVRGSFDFIGVNYYTTYWAKHKPTPEGTVPSHTIDQEVEELCEWQDQNGKKVKIGKRVGEGWLVHVPRGILGLLKHIKTTYGNPVIYITENGCEEENNPKLTVSQALHDKDRIDYLVKHLAYLRLAIEEDVRVMGYYVWSLFDNFEWMEGYTMRFGLYLVDFLNDLKRYPKDSAIWYANFLNKRRLPGPKRQADQEILPNNNKKTKDSIESARPAFTI